MTVEQTLTSLGFTETEALIYCELLRTSPATGYRLAQAIGKAPANTYGALAALTQKGAVVVDDSAGKSFRPVPPAELMAMLQRGFDARARAAVEALEQVYCPPDDDRIYQLTSVAQVVERARAMIGRARGFILFDAFPHPFQQLVEDLRRAAAQKVTVAGLVYAPVDEPHLRCVPSQGAGYVADRWPGAQLSLVSDAEEHLLALLSHDGARVLHGVWSDSPYLATLQHNALASEIRLAALGARAGMPADPFADIALLTARPAGLRRLIGDAPASLHGAV